MSFQFETIESTILPKELKCWIDQQFVGHNLMTHPGFDDQENRFIIHEVFRSRSNDDHSDNEGHRDRVGCIVSQMVFHQLHIKYLVVDASIRRSGLGRSLLALTEESGRRQGCDFAYVETYSYQGPDFYQKCGYSIDFAREGFYALKKEEKFSYIYLSKKLNLEKI